MGFEDKVEQSSGRPCRQTDGWSKRTCELTSSIVPRGTSFHRSVEFEFSSYAYAMACSRVHRNSVPSTHMRCRITASRRARATIAFFIPRRLAICIAQALSHDHFFFIEHDPHHLVSAARYSAAPIDLARLILGARQPKHRPDCFGLAEASGDVDGGAIGQRH